MATTFTLIVFPHHSLVLPEECPACHLSSHHGGVDAGAGGQLHGQQVLGRGGGLGQRGRQSDGAADPGLPAGGGAVPPGLQLRPAAGGNRLRSRKLLQAAQLGPSSCHFCPTTTTAAAASQGPSSRSGPTLGVSICGAASPHVG